MEETDKLQPGRRTPVDAGLLVLRLGIGLAFLAHGVPKILGGPETWQGLGRAMAVFGIGFAPTFWGFMAAFAEAFGALSLLLGLLLRPFAALMFFTMAVAAAMHLGRGDGFAGASHALELAVVFLALLISGGGAYGVGRLIGPLRRRWYC